MHRSVLMIIQSEQRPLPQLKRFVNKLLRLQARRVIPRAPRVSRLM